MRTLSLICFLSVGPAAVMAEVNADTLMRMEAGTVAMTDNLLDFYVSRVPELAEVRPDMSWNDEFREAGHCILDGLQAHGGDEGVGAYLTALEDFAAMEIANFREMTQKMPEVLSDPVALELSSTCGMIALGTARMDASGLNDAFAADGVMERVLAPAE